MEGAALRYILHRWQKDLEEGKCPEPDFRDEARRPVDDKLKAARDREAKTLRTKDKDRRTCTEILPLQVALEYKYNA